MKTLLIAVAVLILSSAAGAQQHALTLDVCKDDASLWNHEAHEEVEDAKTHYVTEGTDKLPVTELWARGKEMIRCGEMARKSPQTQQVNCEYVVREDAYLGAFSDASINEMLVQCRTAEKFPPIPYGAIGLWYYGDAQGRFVAFVDRHHLRQQVIDEDAAGLR